MFHNLFDLSWMFANHALHYHPQYVYLLSLRNSLSNDPSCAQTIYRVNWPVRPGDPLLYAWLAHKTRMQHRKTNTALQAIVKQQLLTFLYCSSIKRCGRRCMRKPLMIANANLYNQIMIKIKTPKHWNVSQLASVFAWESVMHFESRGVIGWLLFWVSDIRSKPAVYCCRVCEKLLIANIWGPCSFSCCFQGVR